MCSDKMYLLYIAASSDKCGCYHKIVTIWVWTICIFPTLLPATQLEIINCGGGGEGVCGARHDEAARLSTEWPSRGKHPNARGAWRRFNALAHLAVLVANIQMRHGRRPVRPFTTKNAKPCRKAM